MEKAIISLSFDDGRGDNLAVFRNILIPMSIPATLNITTGYVDGTCPEYLLPSPKPAVTVTELITLGQNPLVEIAMHGDCHLNTAEDIAKGREKLINWFDLEKSSMMGFASPGSGLKPEEFIISKHPLFKQQMSYMRTSLRINSIPWCRILCRKAGRVFHLPILFRIAYADTLMKKCDDRVVYSIPVMKDTTCEQIKSMVDLAIKRRSALTLMFHSILNNVEDEDNWAWEYKKFVELCRYLESKRMEGLLDIKTTQQLVKDLQC